MNEDDSNSVPEDAPSDQTMEVENPDVFPEQLTQRFDEVHPLALGYVAINVIEDSDATSDQGESAPSTPAPSPQNLDEESNQSEPDSRPSKKRTLSEEEKDDDGSLCPICFDNWTNSGEHRVCSLKCGHLFGLKCIKRWFSTQKKRSCPTCKLRVGKDDIRYIYAKKLTAVDTVELEGVKEQLRVVTDERNRYKSELAICTYREQLLQQEVSQLKLRLGRIGHYNVPNLNPEVERVKLYMDKAMEICKFGGSRVFDARAQSNILMASMKSPNNLFQGFCLKKIQISDYRTLSYIPVHSLQIRDICFHKENNWVLTASMDKTFKVINNQENGVIYQFPHQMPLWSCCWDLNNTYCLYVGTQSGSVIKYDIRHLSDAISTFSIEGDMSPVVSVASIPSSPGNCLTQGGILSCKLNSLWLYEAINEDYVRHSISLEGPFVSMKYQETTKQLLVSSRPNSRISYARHTLSTLEKSDEKIDCNIIHTFQGGGMQKLLSKSCFLTHVNDYVAAHQENCKSVFLWSINTGQKVASITAHESVLDLKGLQNQNGNFLVSLTDKKLEFFKFAS